MTNVLRVLMASEAMTFLVGAVLHLGIPVFGLTEPPIAPAALVEALCGAGLATAAWWYSRVPWGTSVALSAHALAVAGVLLGMAALAAGRGPSTPLNALYHRTILIALIGTAVMLVVNRRSSAPLTQ
jgi:hypothetical protein